MSGDEWNDRHGYSQPTLAQYDALRVERDALAAKLAKVEADLRVVVNGGAADQAALDAAVSRLRAALADPEGEQRPIMCEHGWTRAHCGSCHDEVYGPGPEGEQREDDQPPPICEHGHFVAHNYQAPPPITGRDIWRCPGPESPVPFADMVGAPEAPEGEQR